MSDAPKILAIDGASYFGFAIGRAGERPRSGSRWFAKGQGASQGAVFSGAMKWLSTVIDAEHPDMIVIEAPLNPEFTKGFSNINNVEVSFGLAGCLHGMAFLRGIYDFESVQVRQVRSHFIGKNIKGPEGKQAVWRKCMALGWINSTDDDLTEDRTDALALWSYAETKIAPKLCQPVDDLFIKSSRRAA
jgi:hypothetical protein